MKIRAKNCVLKNGVKVKLFTPTVADAQQCADHINIVMKESPYIAPDPREGAKTAEDEINWIKKYDADNRLLIAASVDGKIVGICEITGKSGAKTQHYAGFGLAIQAAYSGQGLANIMMKTIFKEIEKSSLEFVELDVVKENAAARHLYEKFGFKEYGVIPKKFKYADGSYADLIYMVKELR